MTLEEGHALGVAPHWRLAVVDSHWLAHLGAIAVTNAVALQMVTVRIQLDRPIEELLERRVHSHVVLRCHHVVVLLPIVYFLEVLLQDYGFLDVLSDILDEPISLDSTLELT